MSRRYLLRCRACDRAFWQAERGTPLPPHPRWDRRATAPGDDGPADHCSGSDRPGIWIGEGEGVEQMLPPAQQEAAQ